VTQSQAFKRLSPPPTFGRSFTRSDGTFLVRKAVACTT
jgi:hypothetical protein